MSASDPSDPAKESRAAAHLEVTDKTGSEPLRVCVKEAVENYFRHLDGHDMSELFDLVMTEVEAPLLESVLEYTRGNQSRAAAILGINRVTLRKKLKRYNLI